VDKCKPLAAGGGGPLSKNQRESVVEQLLSKERVLVLLFNRAFAGSEEPPHLLVGRCRLAVSNPVLKAPQVSALETGIS
jgi:hypothetical protein